jgi:hypothetical protein
MAFMIDEGSEFNAPISKIWALAQSEAVQKHELQ